MPNAGFCSSQRQFSSFLSIFILKGVLSREFHVKTGFVCSAMSEGVISGGGYVRKGLYPEGVMSGYRYESRFFSIFTLKIRGFCPEGVCTCCY